MNDEREQRGHCGHRAQGNLGPLACCLPTGHPGWHEQRVTLRRSNGPGTYVERTNWGDDGLAIHASTDSKRREEARGRV